MERDRNNRKENGGRPRASLTLYTPKLSVSGEIGYLKGKSSLKIYQKLGTANFQYRCREIRRRGYYVDTTGKNRQVIEEYIQKSIKTR